MEYQIKKLQDLYQKCNLAFDNDIGYSSWSEIDEYISCVKTNPFIRELLSDTYLTVSLRAFLDKDSRSFTSKIVYSKSDLKKQLDNLHKALTQTARNIGYALKEQILISQEVGVVTLKNSSPEVVGYEIKKAPLRWKILKVFVLNPTKTCSRQEIAELVGKSKGISNSKDISEAITGMNKQFKKDLGGLRYDLLIKSKVSNKMFYRLNTVDYELLIT